MRIAIVSHKGGTGRTTTAVLLAAWLATRDRTMLADLDFYPAAHTWARSRSLPFDVATAGDEPGKPLAQLADETAHLVIDTPSHDDTRLHTALGITDVALVPTRPAPLDLWSLRATSEAMHGIGQELQSWVLLTMTHDAATALAARKTIEQDDLIGLPTLEPVLSWRSEYASFMREHDALPDLTEIASVGEALLSDHTEW